jgi:hypothetical protein
MGAVLGAPLTNHSRAAVEHGLGAGGGGYRCSVDHRTTATKFSQGIVDALSSGPYCGGDSSNFRRRKNFNPLSNPFNGRMRSRQAEDRTASPTALTLLPCPRSRAPTSGNERVAEFRLPHTEKRQE